jgi:hypothetical protein
MWLMAIESGLIGGSFAAVCFSYCQKGIPVPTAMFLVAKTTSVIRLRIQCLLIYFVTTQTSALFLDVGKLNHTREKPPASAFIAFVDMRRQAVWCESLNHV